VTATIRLRQPMHSGSVLASGLAISTALTGEKSARARLLAHGHSEVFRSHGFLIAKFAEPIRLSTYAARGTLLVRYSRLLSMAPLTADEIAALEVGDEAAVLVAGSAALRVPLNGAAREDVSNWLDVSGFGLISDIRPLGEVGAAPRAAVTPAKAVREIMGVTPMEAQTQELIQALLNRNIPKDGALGGATRPPSFPWLHGLLGFLTPRYGTGAATGGNGGGSIATNAAARLPLVSRLKAATAEMLWSSRLAWFLGRQHAKYLNQVLKMFDADDLDAALRHALPLNSELEAASRGLPLWTPKARKDLTISRTGLASSTSLNLETSFFEELRNRYRRAYERLAAAGEIEKAAYVLAELLNAPGEAVEFLERHRKYRLAAEIAEAKKLEAALVIKFWFLAGERDRAIRIARITGAFSYAVLKLTPAHQEEANALRLLWANTLISGGNYGAAVDAAMPVENARDLLADWIERAIETGGMMGARMLARKARLFPESLAEVHARAEDLFAAEDEELSTATAEYARELIKPPISGGDAMLARSAARHFLQRDDAPLVRELLKACGDSLLQADARLPRLSGWPRANTAIVLRNLDTPLEIHRLAADRGAVEIYDAAALPGGRMLVAAGETGVFLLSREGKIQMRFVEPAHHIVISDQADRAILLARRGEIYHLSRLDIASKQASVWCDARFDVFTPHYDGLNWFVGRGSAVYAIDATAKRWEHLWKVDEADAIAHAVSRSATALSIKFDWPRKRSANSEAWTYELPSLMLRRRRDCYQDEVDPVMSCVAPNGAIAGLKRRVDDTPLKTPLKIYLNHGWINLPCNFPGDAVAAPTMTDDWLTLQVHSEDDNCIHLFDCVAGRERARIRLDGAGKHCRVRIQGERLIVCDSAGRVLALSLKSGGIVSEHRLTI
jgi:hypothetical protein